MQERMDPHHKGDRRALQQEVPGPAPALSVSGTEQPLADGDGQHTVLLGIQVEKGHSGGHGQSLEGVP